MNFIVSIRAKGFHIPSFKNHKHSNRHGFVYTDRRVKKLMQDLESSILSGLYSTSQTTANETDSGCWKQLRTALSGLCDDSVREIPECSFSTKECDKGQEGVTIEIYEI